MRLREVLLLCLGAFLLLQFLFHVLWFGPERTGLSEYSGLGLGILIVGSFVIGLMLPRTRSIGWSVELPHPPTVVWRVIANESRLPEWVPGLKSVTRITENDAPDIWREDYEDSVTVVEIAEAIAPSRLHHRHLVLCKPGGLNQRISTGYAGSGTVWEIAPTATGSRLSFSIYVEADEPIFRLFVRIRLKPRKIQAATEEYLAALEKRLQQLATNQDSDQANAITAIQTRPRNDRIEGSQE
jgi:Polyketide cyclase / dehydrase and lipid transport